MSIFNRNFTSNVNDWLMDMHSNRLSIDNSIFVGSFGSIGLKYEAKNKEEKK